ncbi:MAG: methylated-DNA--[protein]-cysteine S-methyltransferase [Chloroflexota bacterium]|nr:MAG: methylated-DNA--[protein]-cysteine S-methyltransferase [Chloroflexota bacterium]
MEMQEYQQLSQDYARIEQAIGFIRSHLIEQPTLSEMAQSVNLSEYHFQRIFSRWVGISPKRFLQYLTKEQAKHLLAQSNDLLSASYSAGLSGPGRLHDLFVTCEAVTPGEYKLAGEGVEITFGIHPSPFGECLVACTRRGINNLVFINHQSRESAISNLKKRWPAAKFIEEPSQTAPVIDEMMNIFHRGSATPVRLYLRGTNFQIKVWEALLQIEPGSLVSYQDVAMLIGMPKASQAVGNAISHNPIPVLIPCHRVIRKNGEFGNYRWGANRKMAILGWEMAKYDLAHQDSKRLLEAA